MIRKKDNRPVTHPLPADVAALRRIKAEHWATVRGAGYGIEGPAFDRDGNLYVCSAKTYENVDSKIFKIDRTGACSEFYDSGLQVIRGIAIHNDGRLFAVCMGGEVLIISPDGRKLQQLRPIEGGREISGNDLVFDGRGNLYITDMQGNDTNRCGRILRLDAAQGYQEAHLVCGALASPNGVSLTPCGGALWVGESGSNTVTRIQLGSDGYQAAVMPVMPVYRGIGYAHPDSNAVDSAGNLYQAFFTGGRVLIFEPNGVPIAVVLMPGREQGKNLKSTNVALRPGTDEGYAVAFDDSGASVFRFTALAPAHNLYSHGSNPYQI